MVNSHKDLIVWQKSVELVKEIYRVTNELPKSEIYGLTSQMRRASVSIPSNIAEGRKRGSRKDFTQFLRVALGSSAELETQLILVEELYNVEKTQKAEELLVEIQKILATMIKKLTSYKLEANS